MQKTKKKLFTRILALILCLIMCCSTVYAAGDYNQKNEDSSVGPPDKHKGNGGGITTDTYFDDTAQGFRFYVVDSSGNVMQTTYGTDAIDVVFSGVTTKPSNVRLRVNNQSATTKYLSFNSVFNNVGAEKNFYPVYCLNQPGGKSNGGKRKNGTIIKRLMQDWDEYFSPAGPDIDYCHYLVDTYWQAGISKDFYKLGYRLVLENTFSVTLVKNKKKTGQKFYGSCFEWGQFNKTNGTIDGGYRRYVYSFVPTAIQLGHTDLGVNPVSSAWPTDSQLADPTQGYGINIFYDIYKDPGVVVEPPSDHELKINNTEMQATKSAVPVAEKIEDLAIMTGYHALDGMYDIGVSGGIPTTETVTNSIMAENCLVNIDYRVQPCIPIRMPVVTYNLAYTYRWYTTHEREVEDGGYWDKNKKWVTTYRTEEYEVEHTETRYVEQSVPVPRAAGYYYVADYAVYGLDSVDVMNAAGEVSYVGLEGLRSDEVKIIVSGQENPSVINGTDPLQHVSWENCKDIYATNGTIGVGGNFGSLAEAQSWLNSNAFTWANANVGYPIVKSDYVEIDGIVYMDDKEYTGKENTDHEYVTFSEFPKLNIQKRVVKDAQNHTIRYDLLNGTYYTSLCAMYTLIAGTEEQPYMRIFDWTATNSDKSHIYQASDIFAGMYDGRESTATPSIPKTVTLKDGTTKSYLSQEPIHVITPVIAPFEVAAPFNMPDLTAAQKQQIWNSISSQELTNEEKEQKYQAKLDEYEFKQNLWGTQLPEGKENQDTQQLRLDEFYSFSFSPRMHNDYLGYGYSGFIDNENYWNGRDGYETDNKYDKYVLEKYVKFPFDVYIDDILFTANTWVCLYSYDPQTGNTTSGDVKGNHLKTTSFYIPPWAEELTANIEVAVYAINYEAGVGREFNDWVLDYNAEDSTYFARYAVTVQTSGWVSDFEIVGSSPGDEWVEGEEAHDWMSKGFVSFSEYEDEFYSGIYNRTGNNGDANDTKQRRNIDGKVVKLVEDDDPFLTTAGDEYSARKDTLPISDGSSELSKINGSLIRNSDISFKITTIANLNENDKIQIKPRYTYYPMEYFETGDESLIVQQEDLFLYYDNRTELYVEFDSERDDRLKTRLGYNFNEVYKAYNRADVTYFAEKNGYEDDLDLLYKWTEVSSFGKILIPGKDLMLYDTTALEELKINQGREPDNLINILGSDFKGHNANLGDMEDTLIQSVQTWYGRYFIPDMHACTRQSMEELGYDNPIDYALDHAGFTEMEDFWIKDGFMMLSFDITVYKAKPVTDEDGNPVLNADGTQKMEYSKWLTYDKGTSDQWQRQGLRKTMQVWADHLSINKWHFNTPKSQWTASTVYKGFYELPVKSGDIALIDMARHSLEGFYSELVIAS